jgi:hypothetical protein
MKFKMLTTATAAAAMAMAPVAAHASPTLMAAQTTQTTQTDFEADDGQEFGVQIAIVFFLIVFAIAIFASDDGDGSAVSP